MLFESEYARSYIFAALEAGPILFERAIRGMTAEAADRRPDAERFTVREVIAHLADWDGIFLYRMRRMVEDDCPTLPGYEPDDLAVANNYVESDPQVQLQKWSAVRSDMIAYLKARSLAEYQRTAKRPEIAEISLLEQALLIPLHDTYHLKQVQEILE